MAKGKLNCVKGFSCGSSCISRQKDCDQGVPKPDSAILSPTTGDVEGPGVKPKEDYGLDEKTYDKVRDLLDRGVEPGQVAKITNTSEDTIKQMKQDKEDGERLWGEANNLISKGLKAEEVAKATGIPKSIIEDFLAKKERGGSGDLIGGIGQMIQYVGGLADQAAEAAIEAADQAIEQIEEVEGWG